MNLIILLDEDRLDNGRYRLGDHRAEHIRNVLKRGAGERVAVGILNGPRGEAMITYAGGDHIELEPGALEPVPTPQPEIDIICALPRPQTLKKVLLTSAMMGVRALYLVRANRVEKSYFHSPLLKPERQRTYLIEGLSQGKLTRLPRVSVYEKFRPFVEDTLESVMPPTDASTLRLLPDVESAGSLNNVFDTRTSDVMVAIGPEGGWVPFEIELMESRGFRRFALGRSVLRVETALAASLAQIELLTLMRR